MGGPRRRYSEAVGPDEPSGWRLELGDSAIVERRVVSAAPRVELSLAEEFEDRLELRDLVAVDGGVVELLRRVA